MGAGENVHVETDSHYPCEYTPAMPRVNIRARFGSSHLPDETICRWSPPSRVQDPPEISPWRCVRNFSASSPTWSSRSLWVRAVATTGVAAWTDPQPQPHRRCAVSHWIAPNASIRASKLRVGLSRGTDLR